MTVQYNLYAMLCPITDKVRYIGYTKFDLAKRLRFHINSSKVNDKNTHRGKWIQSLLKQGLKPVMKLLHTVTENVKEMEKFLIAHFKQFCDLVNGTAGGDGVTGRIFTEEQKIKASKLRMGVCRTDYCKEILLTNMEDGSLIPCASVFDAANWLKCSPNSIRDAARGTRVKTIFNHIVNYNK